MDKTSQRIAAVALTVLGVYSHLRSAFVQVPFAMPVVVVCFWLELGLMAAMTYGIRGAPIIVVPTMIAVFGVLLPSAASVLTWSATYLKSLLP